MIRCIASLWYDGYKTIFSLQLPAHIEQEDRKIILHCIGDPFLVLFFAIIKNWNSSHREIAYSNKLTIWILIGGLKTSFFLIWYLGNLIKSSFCFVIFNVVFMKPYVVFKLFCVLLIFEIHLYEVWISFNILEELSLFVFWAHFLYTRGLSLNVNLAIYVYSGG